MKFVAALVSVERPSCLWKAQHATNLGWEGGKGGMRFSGKVRDRRIESWAAGVWSGLQHYLASTCTCLYMYTLKAGVLTIGAEAPMARCSDMDEGEGDRDGAFF